MKSSAWLISGLVAGVVGAAVWAGIVYFTGYEIGFIAWGMGVLVGFAVAAGAQGKGSAGTGIGAACIAAASVLGGKYAVTHLMVSDYFTGEGAEEFAEMAVVDEEFLVSEIADQLIEQREEAGETIEWPEYDEYDPDVTLTETYPAEIWADAQARWDNADDAYREQHRAFTQAKVDTMMQDLKSIVVEQGFLDSFTLWDLLWLGLAVASAWRIGSGGGE